MNKTFESTSDVLEEDAPAASQPASAPPGHSTPSLLSTPADRASTAPLATTGLLATVAAALAACGGGTGADSAGTSAAGASTASGAKAGTAVSGEGSAAASPAVSPGTKAAPADQVDLAAGTSRTELIAEIVRFLLQAQFNAPDADIDTIRVQGYDAWLTQQFNAPMSQGGYDWLVSSGNTDPFKGEFFFNYTSDSMAWQQLFSSPDQMRKRLALALSEMFVVSVNAFDAFWPGCFTGAYWDLLVKNAFGNFRAMLEDITLSPAMGRYLNTLGNLKEDPATGRQPDENYSREVMQLFTIGLYELNLDGTPKLNAQGKQIDSYTQSDVRNLARVFTGYEYDYTGVRYIQTPFQPYPIPTPENARNRMKLNAANHSNLSATFLGTTVPANTPGATALKTALDTLFNHPNVGPFFAKQMIQRLVTSNPSPAYVQRVATVFNNNGAGVRGDMKAFWKALFMDVEARTIPIAAGAGKLREPIVRAVQWARTFNVTTSTGQWNVGDQSSTDYGLSQSPLRSASVFNFFRPGYVPPRTGIAAAGLVAPEFQIHNESTTVAYLNYLSNWVRGQFGWGTNNGNVDIKVDYSVLLPLASNTLALLNWLNMRLTAFQLTDGTLRAIYSSLNSYPVNANSSDAVKLNRIYAAVLLIMASPEYLVQK
jgi:uncharacterized protein (DUF1800 family)